MKFLSKTDKGGMIVELEPEDMKFVVIEYGYMSKNIAVVRMSGYEFDKSKEAMIEAKQRLENLIYTHLDVMKTIAKAGTLLGLVITDEAEKKARK